MNKEIEIPEGYEARIEGNKVILEPKESKDERIVREILETLRYGLACEESVLMPGATTTLKEAIAYLERQKEQQPVMIQWTGKNLKEVIDFTGKSQKFGEWFKSWEEFENYVHSHGDILKLFCEDGSHYEVPVGAWIVKTPDGYNTPSRFRFIQKPVEWDEDDEACFELILRELEQDKKDSPEYSRHFTRLIDWFIHRLKSLRPQPKQEWSETDKLHLNNAILVAKKEWGVNSYTARFLESLRDNCKKCNNHWKPSEEQMEILQYLCEHSSHANPDVMPTLESLYHDLQKLL